MEEGPTYLSVQGLHLSFGGTQALLDVSFNVQQGGILAIIGHNGAGKTSLLNCLNGFYRPSQGRILFEGDDVTRLPTPKIARLGIAQTFPDIALYTGLITLDDLMAARNIHMRAGFFHCMV